MGQKQEVDAQRGWQKTAEQSPLLVEFAKQASNRQWKDVENEMQGICDMKREWVDIVVVAASLVKIVVST